MATDADNTATNPRYDLQAEKIGRFLSMFQEENATEYKYIQLIREVHEKKSRVIAIELDDLQKFEDDDELVGLVTKNTFRYIEMFCDEIDKLAPTDLSYDHDDPIDVMRMQRQHQREQQALDDEEEEEEELNLPAELVRRYELSIKPLSTQPILKQREVRAKDIGSLVVVTGVVTRATEVKPLLRVATYTCDNCGFEVYQQITKPQFMPLLDCPTKKCQTRSGGGKLHLQTRGSKFMKFQELRLQEKPDEVPIGHIPRSIRVHCLGETTRKCSPGDYITLTAVFLPTPYSGYQAMRAGLIADTFLYTIDIQRAKKSYTDYELTTETIERIQEFAQEPEVYSRLAHSIAPEIFGHEDVKKALLLLMVGGVTKQLPDGMKIRGDINACLMGDPGVAKSQLLKQIATIVPRGIYTSGKGSTGVGLTAAVVRDQTTGDFVLEGGSLVLADMGVCCIDEFDKMDESDRTAIHEVMEQQTISIAKGGITTTLNARTSILAAANPAYGRYNPYRSPSENINLPPALLSRFDLMFVLLDKPDYEADLALAQHVAYVHSHFRAPEPDFQPVSAEFLRSYIAQARRIDPYVPEDLTSFIVGAYVNMRAKEAQDENPRSYTTARSLLSILRLSQALARLRLENIVTTSDVEEAMRLMYMSKASLLDTEQPTRSIVTDPLSSIYTIIRNIAAAQESTQVSYDEIVPRVLKKGFTQQQLNACLEEYEELNVWQVSTDKRVIQFVE